VAVSLADQIRAAREAASAFIDAQVDAIKAGRAEDGGLLPFAVLRQMLTGGNSKCACAAALELLAIKTETNSQGGCEDLACLRHPKD
jgi:hypothetical protein